MLSSKLSSRVQIQARSSDQDALGQPLEAWSTIATVWADIRMKSGLEAIKGGVVSSTVQASVRIRSGVAVDSSMRVVHGAAVYQVLAVLPDAGRAFVDLVVESVQ